MLTIRHLLVAGGAGLFAVPLVSTASAEARRVRGPQHGEHGERDESARAQFAAAPACQIPNSSRLQFVSSRNPFRGGSPGAYGSIFFGGGGTTVASSSRSASAASTSQGAAAA